MAAYVDAVMCWVCDECREKFNMFIDVRDWLVMPNHPLAPQQQNGYDCGVFVLTNAAFIVDDIMLDYPTSNSAMEQQRYRIALSILQRLLPY